MVQVSRFLAAAAAAMVCIGEAFIYAAPDTAEITFELKATDASAETAFARVNARLAELQALMAAQSLPDALAVGEVRRELLAAKDGNPEAAVIKCSVRIMIEDLNKWKAVAGPVLVMPDVDKLAVFFDVSKRDDIDNELLVEASKVARKRADAIARAFGRQVTTAAAITDGQLRNLSLSIGLVTGNAASNRSKRMEPSVDLTSITVMKFAKSVDVVFRTK